MLQVFECIVHLRFWSKLIHQGLFLVTFPPRQWLHPTLPPLHQGMSLVRWGGLDDKVTANKLTWNAWWRAQKKSYPTLATALVTWISRVFGVWHWEKAKEVEGDPVLLVFWCFRTSGCCLFNIRWPGAKNQWIVTRNITGDPLHSRALAHSRAPLFTQPCPHCSHSRAPGEQWARLCVFTLQGCVQAARLCRGSPVNIAILFLASNMFFIAGKCMLCCWCTQADIQCGSVIARSVFSQILTKDMPKLAQ